MPPGEHSLAPASALRIDQICDRFEAEWKAGHRPALEAFATEMPEPDRAELLRELLHIELAYRCKVGELVFVEEYQLRLPEQANRIQEAFQEWAVNTPPTPRRRS